VLRRELEETRAAGVAYGREEFHQGICAMASPVFNLHGNVIAALTVTLPSSRFTPENSRFIEPRLKQAAAAISSLLGHGGGNGAHGVNR